ncbi:hypothetical protein BDV96DRAFT_26088 [Lophiotrema nucula]|uniref:Fungal N-terminal domain-containing protein n=1 Tax=Lophiotrema nucula TaxID=690887 RepID=A0A6A5ZE08_9PLEO|nr:hypothetical protein BDV96DRAFT_26088 [Lophiotrema nucula]
MAGFGFSISDIVLVSNYAYTVYKSCKRAGEDFKAVTADVKSLQAYLSALNTEFERPNSLAHRSTPTQQDELRDLLRSCQKDLKGLKDRLLQYKSLKTSNPRTRDKLKFTARKQGDIRGRVVGHSDRLSRFLNALHTGSLARLELSAEKHEYGMEGIKAQLDALHQEFVSGRRDGSIITDFAEWSNSAHGVSFDSLSETDLETNASVTENILRHLSKRDSTEETFYSIAELEESRESTSRLSDAYKEGDTDTIPCTGSQADISDGPVVKEYQATSEDHNSEDESEDSHTELKRYNGDRVSRDARLSPTSSTHSNESISSDANAPNRAAHQPFLRPQPQKKQRPSEADASLGLSESASMFRLPNISASGGSKQCFHNVQALSSHRTIRGTKVAEIRILHERGCI